MTPIAFDGCNTVYGAGQPNYLPLPAHDSEGRVTSCWQLTWRERLIVMITCRLWLQQLNFGKSLQPQKPHVDRPVL